MNRVRSLTVGIVAALVLALGPGLALAGPSVHGHGRVILGPGQDDNEISIDAWLDDAGVAHGMMEWTGGGLPNMNFPGGPSNPFHLEVTGLTIVGNTAYISAVVVHIANGTPNGQTINYFTFTDNSGTADPDEIDGVPIEAGNIIVND